MHLKETQTEINFLNFLFCWKYEMIAKYGQKNGEIKIKKIINSFVWNWVNRLYRFPFLFRFYNSKFVEQNVSMTSFAEVSVFFLQNFFYKNVFLEYFIWLPLIYFFFFFFAGCIRIWWYRNWFWHDFNTISI